MLVKCPIGSPLRSGLTTSDRFDGEDQGLIWCWEQGRMMAEEGHPFAELARRRELPQLTTWRRGTLNYFALWTGLRGEDLDIDPTEGFAVLCRGTDQWWVFGPEGEWKEKLQSWLDARYRKRQSMEDDV